MTMVWTLNLKFELKTRKDSVPHTEQDCKFYLNKYLNKFFRDTQLKDLVLSN